MNFKAHTGVHRLQSKPLTSSDSLSIRLILLGSDSSNLLTGGDMRSSSRWQESSDPVRMLNTRPTIIVVRKPSNEYHKYDNLYSSNHHLNKKARHVSLRMISPKFTRHILSASAWKRLTYHITCRINSVFLIALGKIQNDTVRSPFDTYVIMNRHKSVFDICIT